MKVSLESLETRKLLSGTVGFNVPTAASIAYKLVEGANNTATIEPVFGILPVSSFPAGPWAHLTHTGTLMIQGTSGDDKITVIPSVNVVTNADKSVTTTPQIAVLDISSGIFDAADVKRIVVDAAAGNDKVIISPQITLHTTLIGGNGNDTLVGGGGSDVLSGGAGKDKLFASTTTIVDSNGQSTVYGLAQAQAEPIIDLNGVSDKVETTATPSTSTIQQSSKIADSMDGGAGNDTLYASNGPDTINGDDGKDTLVIIGRGSTQPPQIIFRRGNDDRFFDGLTFSSIEAIDVM